VSSFCSTHTDVDSLHAFCNKSSIRSEEANQRKKEVAKAVDANYLRKVLLRSYLAGEAALNFLIGAAITFSRPSARHGAGDRATRNNSRGYRPSAGTDRILSGVLVVYPVGTEPPH